MDKIIIDKKSGIYDSNGKELYATYKNDGSIYLCRRYFPDFVNAQSYAQKLAKRYDIAIIELRGMV